MNPADSTLRPGPTRREMLGYGLGAFVVAISPFALGRRRKLVRRTLPVMGTIAEFAVVSSDARHAEAAIDAAMGELTSVDRTMTRFDTRSEVGVANLEAAMRPVAISAPTAEVIREALAWAETTGGAFDPCLGRVIRLWDVTHRTAPPEEGLVRHLAGRRFYRALELDSWRGSDVVRFRDPEVQIDLGGIAKGFGVDRAVARLREWGIGHALVNVGGDLYALGRSVDGDPWRIGVRSASDPARLSGEIDLEDAAVATSGDYLQCFHHGGHTFHHLLDPDTGAPRATDRHSLSIVAPTCLAADAAATALYGMPLPQAERVLAARAPGSRVADSA